MSLNTCQLILITPASKGGALFSSDWKDGDWRPFFVGLQICVIRRYRMNLGGGVPAGAPREPRVDRQNLQLPDLWSSLLAANKHWMDRDGSRTGREFDQSPVYNRAYIGWWRPDFSLVQFCNRNFSCGVRMQGLLRKMYIYFWKAWRFGLLCNLSVQR